MRVGEWGITIRVNAGYDLTDYDTLTLVLTAPDGGANVSTTPTVGTTAVTTDQGETYAANEYVEYVTQDGDIDEAGEWTAQLTYVENTVIKLIGTPAYFTVDAAS